VAERRRTRTDRALGYTTARVESGGDLRAKLAVAITEGRDEDAERPLAELRATEGAS
jgi:hypothetical protein